MTTLTFNKHVNNLKAILRKDYDHEQLYIPMSREFTREYRKMLSSMIKHKGWKLSPPTPPCYCEVSGFIINETGEKFVYFHTSDFRYWEDEWKDRILIRTATSLKDYHGGSNHYTDLENFVSNVEMIFGRM